MAIDLDAVSVLRTFPQKKDQERDGSLEEGRGIGMPLDPARVSGGPGAIRVGCKEHGNGQPLDDVQRVSVDRSVFAPILTLAGRVQREEKGRRRKGPGRGAAREEEGGQKMNVEEVGDIHRNKTSGPHKPPGPRKLVPMISRQALSV